MLFKYEQGKLININKIYINMHISEKNSIGTRGNIDYLDLATL